MKVSVVSCTFRRPIQTWRGLMSLIRQSSQVNEIVLVDDGSNDDTPQKAKGLEVEAYMKGIDFKYVYLNHPEHRISSIPRNIGFRNTTGDTVFFTEPECLHVGDTVSQLLGKFDEQPENSHLASQVWTIQRKVYEKLSEDNFARPTTILNHPYAQLTHGDNLTNTKAPDSDWAITGQYNCAAGCLFGVKRNWFEDIGGFDEDFVGHGGDDFNLYDRLAIYGHGIVKHDDVVVIHQWHEKNYPYNIYDTAERNLNSWKERLAKGNYIANEGREWGIV